MGSSFGVDHKGEFLCQFWLTAYGLLALSQLFHSIPHQAVPPSTERHAAGQFQI